MALAMATWPMRFLAAWAWGPPAAASFSNLGSSSTSMRLKKKLATDATRFRGRPWAARASSPRDIGLRHLPVAGQAEEQGDVDVDALTDELPDGGQSLLGGRHLDQDIGAVQGLPQAPGLGNGAVGVVGQVGIDLQADEAVFALQLVIEGPEDVRGLPHVRHGQGLVNLLDGLTRLGQGADIRVIIGAPGNGLFEKSTGWR